MVELKEQIEKMEKDIKSLVANQKSLKEEMQNNNTILNDELVLVLERRLDEKFDILNEKQKYLDDKMSTMTQNINTLTQNMSTMTQNHNTLIEMLQKLIPSPSQVSSLDMLDASFHVATQETLAKNQEELQKEIKINNATLKQEIETQVLPDMEARLNNKIDAISKIVEKIKLKITANNEAIQICHFHCPVVPSHHQTIRKNEINVVLTKCTHLRKK